MTCPRGEYLAVIGVNRFIVYHNKQPIYTDDWDGKSHDSFMHFDHNYPALILKKATTDGDKIRTTWIVDLESRSVVWSKIRGHVIDACLAKNNVLYTFT